MAQKNKSSSWLIGCGVGCLFLVLLALGLGAGGVFFVRDTVRGFDEAADSRLEIEERFGAPSDFVPPADGAIPQDRMETFLAIRQATAETRRKIVESFEALPMSREEAERIDKAPFLEKMGAVFQITGSAIGLGGAIGDFFEARNRAFLEEGMGLGEYGYIYALAYYSWLGKSPGDGPGDEAELDRDLSDNYRRVRRNLIANLTNLRDSLPAEGVEAAGSGWPAALDSEIRAMEEERDRVPWQEGLPASIAASLRPYRERLEATYEPISNPFELARTERRGRFTIDVD